MKACNVIRNDYHGGAFEGNQCRTLLKNVDKLKEMIPQEFQGFVETFEMFDRVVSACYSTHLSPDYKYHIENFKTSYMKLNIGVTPKVHAVFWHIIDFCDVVGTGLGSYSEQCSESIHHDFKATWERFKIKDLEHEDNGNKLCQAVCMYNGKHVGQAEE